MEVSVPGSSMLPALFGFNVGLELGQIATVLALCGLGVFWFLQPGFY